MTEPLLSFDALKRAAAAGEIDTVLVCMVDMQGRLVGKRFQVEFFSSTAATKKPTAAITCWPTTSTWSRCRVTPRPAGAKAMATLS